MKSGNLNFLEPSGPPQASNRTALPLPLHVSALAVGRLQGVHNFFLRVLLSFSLYGRNSTYMIKIIVMKIKHYNSYNQVMVKIQYKIWHKIILLGC